MSHRFKCIIALNCWTVSDTVVHVSSLMFNRSCDLFRMRLMKIFEE